MKIRFTLAQYIFLFGRRNRQKSSAIWPMGFLLTACGGGSNEISFESAETNVIREVEAGEYNQPDNVAEIINDDTLGRSYVGSSNVILARYTKNADVNALLKPSDNYKWKAASQVITFSFQEASDAGVMLDENSYYRNSDGRAKHLYEAEKIIFNDNHRLATREALKEFSKFIDIRFIEVHESSGRVGDIRFAGTQYEGDDFHAFAYQPHNSPIGGDIWISPKMMSDDNWEIGKDWDYGSLVHEIGHALGLDHPHEGKLISEQFDLKNYTIMSYEQQQPNGYWENGEYFYYATHLMVYDIAALQHLYGSNREYNSGDTIYKFDPKKPFVSTIWDSGGTDLLDFSNFTLGCKISLEAGSYSSIAFKKWDYPDNLGIAYNCEIENVNGTKAADIIQGNNLNNDINGSSGNDIIYGYAGDDIFDWEASMRAGNDVFYGGLGNDQYVLDSDDDRAIEGREEGIDIVWVTFSGSYQIPENIENYGSVSPVGCNVTDNALDNLIISSDVGEKIISRIGNDVLVGTGGANTFAFELNDRFCQIVDFNKVSDKLLFWDEVGNAIGVDQFEQTLGDDALVLSLDKFSLELMNVDDYII